MKFVYGLLAVVLLAAAAVAWWLFGDAKWSAYRWDKYIQQANCIKARLPELPDNRIVLDGEGETAAYGHRVTLWSCDDGRIVAWYQGLPDTAPRKLFNEDILHYRNGLVGDDDSRRFVSREEVARLKNIRDWRTLVAARPF